MIELPVRDPCDLCEVAGREERSAIIDEGEAAVVVAKHAIGRIIGRLFSLPTEASRVPVRVLIESSDGKDKWGTDGVSHNVIEASWLALADGIDYKLYKDARKGARHEA